jgi:hypothetical protein
MPRRSRRGFGAGPSVVTSESIRTRAFIAAAGLAQGSSKRRNTPTNRIVGFVLATHQIGVAGCEELAFTADVWHRDHSSPRAFAGSHVRPQLPPVQKPPSHASRKTGQSLTWHTASVGSICPLSGPHKPLSHSSCAEHRSDSAALTSTGCSRRPSRPKFGAQPRARITNGINKRMCTPQCNDGSTLLVTEAPIANELSAARCPSVATPQRKRILPAPWSSPRQTPTRATPNGRAQPQR